MDQRFSLHLRFAVLLVVAGLSGCAKDDGLGGVFVPPAGDSDPTDPAVFPLGAGDTLAFSVTRRLLPVPPASATPGTLPDEKQSGSSMCLKIDSVFDGFPDDVPTTINARVWVRGNTATDDVSFGDTRDEQTTPEKVAAQLTPLWLSRLTYAIRGHGFETITAKQFGTRSTVSSLNLGAVLFFDVRSATNCRWGGWRGFGCPGDGTTPSYQSRASVDFSPDSAARGLRTRDATTSRCTRYTDQASCNASGICSFSKGKCRGYYRLELVWRETLDASHPPVMQGQDMVHSLIVRYDLRGALYDLQEFVQPITALNAGDLRPLLQCVEFPCATGSVTTIPFPEASCSFDEA